MRLALVSPGRREILYNKMHPETGLINLIYNLASFEQLSCLLKRICRQKTISEKAKRLKSYF